MISDAGRAAMKFGVWVGVVALFTGCAHIGPKTIPVDRFDYSTAVADSRKQQTLLNIVKLRYMDLPVFVAASWIVSGYSLQTGVSIGGRSRPRRPFKAISRRAGTQAIPGSRDIPRSH